ncbi:uncharacterized protein BJX67DRAFT_363778 [Aspergillus lucknowensis]|uniref:Uncharacterized protein n=1 Tax=Aspergillus lucknowensis TaxID=176173 RepID=A0ABR4LFS9_9EURO
MNTAGQPTVPDLAASGTDILSQEPRLQLDEKENPRCWSPGKKCKRASPGRPCLQTNNRRDLHHNLGLLDGNYRVLLEYLHSGNPIYRRGIRVLVDCRDCRPFNLLAGVRLGTIGVCSVV